MFNCSFLTDVQSPVVLLVCFCLLAGTLTVSGCAGRSADGPNGNDSAQPVEQPEPKTQEQESEPHEQAARNQEDERNDRTTADGRKPSDGESGTKESDEFDRVFTMKVKPGQLLFSTNSFSVPAGGRIKLIFKNNGSLMHNLIICVAGKQSLAMDIAQKAWNMSDPMANGYVPESDKVLAATKLLRANEEQTITFTAPDKPGDHPYVCTFPGHAQTMQGTMHVVTDDSSSGAEAGGAN